MQNSDKISSNSEQNSMKMFRKWVNLKDFAEKCEKKMTNNFWNIKVWAVQKHVNLVDLVKSCPLLLIFFSKQIAIPTNIFLQNWRWYRRERAKIRERFDTEPYSGFSAKWSNFVGLVLFCIDAKFSNKIFVGIAICFEKKIKKKGHGKKLKNKNLDKCT